LIYHAPMDSRFFFFFVVPVFALAEGHGTRKDLELTTIFVFV